DELVTEGNPGERQHATELAPAEHADLHPLFLGSGFASTAAVCLARYAFTASRMCACLLPRISAASSAAFTAPERPIASVPTGMPAGICTIDSMESVPASAADCTGTPNTGSTVFDAVMPGRCAAPPAPAITTSSPRPSAVLAYSNKR